jgi:hypothetical protein
MGLIDNKFMNSDGKRNGCEANTFFTLEKRMTCR